MTQPHVEPPNQDLLHQDEIHRLVDEAYEALGYGAGRLVVERLYTAEQIARLPAGAVAWALGVANPVRHAGLCSGESVLDLGCGAGIDSVLAADEVGPGGVVYGLDSLEAMGGRASTNLSAAGMDGRFRFVHGTMEAIPLPDGSIDVVISNGVINLSPRKSRVLAEVRRVLRPGGRLCVADLVVEDLPPEVTTSDAAWAG